MSVSRTSAGISNEHLFYGAEAIVYVEGGDTTSVYSPLSASVDLLFWRGLFEYFLPGRRFHFKPRGGKSTLLQIVDQLLSGTVTAVVVCLDRDLDHIGGLRVHSAVLYTHGYSWENDVWSGEIVEEVFYTLCGVDRNQVQVREPISEALRLFARSLRWPVRADVTLGTCGRTVVPRHGFRCVTPPDRGWPTIDRVFLRGCTRNARSDTPGVVHKLPDHVQVDVFRDVYGHLLGFFCYRMLTHLVRTHCGQIINKHSANALAISTFRQHMRPEILDYYRRQFASLSYS